MQNNFRAQQPEPSTELPAAFLTKIASLVCAQSPSKTAWPFLSAFSWKGGWFPGHLMTISTFELLLLAQVVTPLLLTL